MRTQQEIIERMEQIEKADVMGFGRSVLIYFLDFENARPYLNDGVTKKEWDEVRSTNPVQCIKEYMKFAWEKAMGERGISAYRSLAKIEQWAWIAADEKLSSLVDSGNYYDYGKAQLADICRYLEVDGWQEWARPDWL